MLKEQTKAKYHYVSSLFAMQKAKASRPLRRLARTFRLGTRTHFEHWRAPAGDP